MVKLFISDLHLEASRPDITALFFKFLNEETKNAEALYILGDFFESYVGDDEATDFHLSVIDALKNLTRKGLPIYFSHGNRDFLVGKRFLRATGIKLLREEEVIRIAGKPTLLMHGDTLCTEDLAYLKFRKKVRNWFVQKLFLLKPLKKRREIADNMRKQSAAYTTMAPENLLDVTQDEVERVMMRHNVFHLIHGHTHRPKQHRFLLRNLPATRTVLGPWHHNGSVLVCYPNGEQELKEFG